MANRVVNQLVKKYGTVMAFKDLPMGFKLSMVWYMAVDGEAWTYPGWAPAASHATMKSWLADNMDFYDKKYGKLKFVMAHVPRKEYEEALVACHKIFAKQNGEEPPKDASQFVGGVNHKTATWPVIFSNYTEELIQDGWHRQGGYLHKKIAAIPCIGYLPRVKYS